MKLKFTTDEAPKFLILAPNEERIDEIVERFYQLAKIKVFASLDCGLQAAWKKKSKNWLMEKILL
jgi:hypothetical protein